MIAELITGTTVVVSLTTLAIYAIAATRRAGDEKSLHAELAVRLEVAIANGKNESARADAEKERADALDAELETVAADGDAAGARERVQRRYARKAAGAGASGGDAGKLPSSGPDPGVASRSDVALLPPGD